MRTEYMFGDDILDVNFVKDILGGSLSIFYLYLWNKFVCLEKRIGEKCQKKLKNFSKPSFHTLWNSLYYGQKVEAELPF